MWLTIIRPAATHILYEGLVQGSQQVFTAQYLCQPQVYMLWVVVWKTHALYIAHEWLQLENIPGLHWFYLLFYSGQSDAITSCSLLFSCAWCWGIEAHIFLHLLWDFDFEFSLASYDNFFPQIRTHSQISTPWLRPLCQTSFPLKKCHPLPPPISLFYILVGI